jgi:glycosyltransferase involved in cell wall biosynthesis
MGDKKLINRTALIGPVLPFRGGIAQHTTQLHRELQQHSELMTISFSRQYPKWLFPGESDRDSEYSEYEEDHVEYTIDSLNPLTWRNAVKQVVAFGTQTVIIPWWTVFWAPCFGYIARTLRSKGIEVVFFCHNVVEHESATWKQWATRLVLQQGSRFVVHTRVDAENLARLLPNATVAVQAHPIYDQFPQAENTLQKRAKLELLFYGFVRPYKGLGTLIEAMGILRGKDIRLTIAGEFWEGRKQTDDLIRKLNLESKIDIRDRYHTEKETAELFARADVVVLPYHSATGSGVVPIAYHYSKPVIVTRVGGLPDVVEHGKTGFIVPVGNAESLATEISHLTRESCVSMQPDILRVKSTLTWKKLTEVLLNDQAVQQ